MPWKESHLVEERMRFVSRVLEGERVSDLAVEYGISRKTAHKFLSRYERLGILGLKDQLRTRREQPHRTQDVVEELLVTLRESHPTWGPKKLKAVLEAMHAGVKVPAASTIGEILSRRGLTQHRRRGIRRTYHRTELTEGKQPNDVWCVDFKGQFRLGNGKLCYPLTVTDYTSRFVLCCDAMDGPRWQSTKDAFVEVFEQYGLPSVIRSDNGTPFASTRSPLGLSRLSAWWLKMGIRPERIEPGCPEQNGRHERFHRTLKQETTRPARQNLLQQQERFDAFIEEFNGLRPHESLGQKPPASFYSASKKILGDADKPLEYPLHDLVREVRADGTFCFLTRHRIWLGESFIRERIGLRQVTDLDWVVTFADSDLGYISRDSITLSSTPLGRISV